MSNPYTSGEDIDPFADPAAARRAEVAAVRQPAAAEPTPPQPGSPAAVASPVVANEQPMEFYNPAPADTAPQSQEMYQPQNMGAPQGQPSQPAGSVPPQHREGEPLPQTRELQTSSFWTFKFYEQFFDVDTKDVLRRVASTMVPTSPPDFLVARRWHWNGEGGDAPAEQQVEKLPDMYGPFWITTTLWMAIAVAGNIVSKIAHSRSMRSRKSENGTLAPATTWTYDFTEASVACVTIYTYCLGMSVLLWGLMKWKNVPVSLLDTLCIYGYSMFVFILASILCIIAIPTLQWFVVIAAGLWSTSFLLFNFWQLWQLSLNTSWFSGIVCVVFAAHMLLAMSFKFYFFAYDL